jgi:hypothetical protein
MYTVYVNRPAGCLDWPWASTYFPRKVRKKWEAKKIAQTALNQGATMVRIADDKGGEMDYWQGMTVK